MKIRGLCISYADTWRAGNCVCSVKPGAVDLSPDVLKGIKICDVTGHVLGIMGDGSAYLHPIDPGDFDLHWHGIALELANLDPNTPADLAAITLIERGAPGFKVDFHDDYTRSERTANGVRYTQLRCQRITLTAERPDPGTGKLVFLDGPARQTRGRGKTAIA